MVKRRKHIIRGIKTKRKETGIFSSQACGVLSGRFTLIGSLSGRLTLIAARFGGGRRWFNRTGGGRSYCTNSLPGCLRELPQLNRRHHESYSGNPAAISRTRNPSSKNYHLIFFKKRLKRSPLIRFFCL